MIQCLNTDYPQQHPPMAVINLWKRFFQQSLKNLERITKIVSSYIFVVRNMVNDPLNAWGIYYISYIAIRILFRIRRLTDLGFYKEIFVKDVYEILSAALLQNKSQKIMPQQTFYKKVLTEGVL